MILNFRSLLLKIQVIKFINVVNLVTDCDQKFSKLKNIVGGGINFKILLMNKILCSCNRDRA